MKAILMAAGKGTRISRLIANIPKCTLPVLEKPIIRRTVEILQDRNIETAVVVGYRYQHVKKSFRRVKCKILL